MTVLEHKRHKLIEEFQAWAEQEGVPPGYRLAVTIQLELIPIPTPKVEVQIKAPPKLGNKGVRRGKATYSLEPLDDNEIAQLRMVHWSEHQQLIVDLILGRGNCEIAAREIDEMLCRHGYEGVWASVYYSRDSMNSRLYKYANHLRFFAEE